MTSIEAKANDFLNLDGRLHTLVQALVIQNVVVGLKARRWSPAHQTKCCVHVRQRLGVAVPTSMLQLTFRPTKGPRQVLGA